MSKQNKILNLLVWSLPIFFLVGAMPAYAYQDYIANHSDYLFEKTMADLKETMAKAREGNDEFLMQNGKLQDAVDALEQSIADTQAEKAKLKREALRLTDEITLADKENNVIQQRLKNFTTRKERLTEAKESLLKHLQTLQADNEQAQTSMASMQEEINQLNAKAHNFPKPTKQKVKQKGNPALLAQLNTQKKRVRDLEQRLASARQQKPSKEKISAPLQKQINDLQSRVAAKEEELSLLREQAGIMRKGMTVVESTEPDSIQDLRRRNDELRSTVSDMKDSISELKRVASHLQPGQESQIKNLEKSLKKVQQAHNTLDKRLAKVSHSPASSGVKRNDKYDALAARKEKLLQEQHNLNNQIADLQAASSQKESMLPGKNRDLRAELTKSQKKVAELQKQLDSAKGNQPKIKNSTFQKLSAQVDHSKEQLAQLQKEYITLSLPASVKQGPDESAKIQTTIEQLRARRAILNESLQAISGKYNLDELTAKGAGTSETELQDYVKVLSNENSALQEKLLILQMQQDKAVPTP